MRKQNIGILQVLGMECESSTGPLLYCGVPCVIPLALAEKARVSDEAESEDLPKDRVLLSSVSKKGMFRFRREAA